MVIEAVGAHRLRVGDARGSVAELLAGEQARIFYCDPPWGPGMMKYFQGKADRAAGRPPSPVRDYRDLLSDLASQAARHTTGPVFIEYGLKWEAEVEETCLLSGLSPLAVIRVVYDGRFSNLHIFAPLAPEVDLWIAQTRAYAKSIEAARGLKLVLAAIQPFVQIGAILLDPCTGLGMSAKAAKRVGMRFYGNELNGARMARAKAVLA